MQASEMDCASTGARLADMARSPSARHGAAGGFDEQAAVGHGPGGLLHARTIKASFCIRLLRQASAPSCRRVDVELSSWGVRRDGVD